MADIIKTIIAYKDEAELIRQAELLLIDIAHKYDIKYEWLDETTAKFSRKGGEGTLEIKGNMVKIEISLKWYAKMFKNLLNEQIDEWRKEQNL